MLEELKKLDLILQHASSIAEVGSQLRGDQGGCRLEELEGLLALGWVRLLRCDGDVLVVISDAGDKALLKDDAEERKR